MMAMNPPSPALSFQLRAAVAAMITVNNLFLLIAIATNHWVNGNGRGNIEFAGIWNICNKNLCEFHSDIIHAKVFLVCSFILGLMDCAAAIMALKFGVTSIKRLLGRFTLLIATFECIGMISGTVYFAILPYFQSVSYGLVFGWLAVVIGIVAGCLSYYHARIEPDVDDPEPQITPDGQNVDPPPSYTMDPPPSYTVDPAPNSIIVS